MTVLLHHRSAPGGVEDDGIQSAVLDLVVPHLDVAGHERQAPAALPHVIGEGATTALALGDHDVHSTSVEQTDGGVVDVGSHHLLDATGEERHPSHRWPLGNEGRRERVGSSRWRSCRRRCRRQLDEMAEAPRHQRRRDPTEPPQAHGPAEASRIGQQPDQQGAQEAVGERTAIHLIKARAGLLQQAGEDDAARAGGLAGQAAEAVVDVGDDPVLTGSDAALQNALDQVDAAPGSLELVAGKQVGGTGGVAESTVYAGAEHLFGYLDIRVVLQLGKDRGLHGCLGGELSPGPRGP